MKIKLTELYKMKENNIIGNPEINVSGSISPGDTEVNPNTTNNMNSGIGPQGPIG